MRRGGGGGGGGGSGGGSGFYGTDSSGGNNNPRSGYAASQPPPHMQQPNNPDHHPTHNQWRWERDGLIQSPMSPNMFNEGQGSEPTRSYYQGQRPDPRMAQDKQGSHDVRSQPRGEEMDVGNEKDLMLQNFDGIEKKFLDDIMRVSKEQSDAEDAENARHREKINAINAQYLDQLGSIRARHAIRRDEFLQRESHSRRQLYQQAAGEHFSGSGFGPSEPQGYSGMSSHSGDPRRSYNAEDYNSYKDRERFPGSLRNHELETHAYPGGRMHDAGSRYY